MRVPEEASSVCRGRYQTVISPRRCFGIDGGVWEFDTVIGGVIRCIRLGLLRIGFGSQATDS